MKIQIKKMVLNHFKGIRQREILFSNNTIIYGDNGTGKTTIADAFLWLLFGKNSEDATSFGIKTLIDGKVIEKIDHEVSAVINVNGNDITLRRVLREKWVKARGKADAEFTGNETTYFVDDVPYKAGEYQAYISNLIDEKLFRLVTNPAYFNSLPWQERRETLVRIAGDVKEMDIAEKDSSFMDLIHEMAKSNKKLEDLKKQISAEKKKLKDELSTIPARIDEVKRGTPDQPNYSEIEKNILENEKQVSVCDKKIEDNTQISKEYYDAIQTRQSRISAIKTAMRGIRSDKEMEMAQSGSNIKMEVTKLQNDLAIKESKLKQITDQIKDGNIILDDLKQKINAQRELWSTENSKQIEFDDLDSICPTCLQELPKEKIDQQHRLMLENFNDAKLKTLEKITERGKAFAKTLEETESKQKEYREQQSQLQVLIAEINGKILAIEPPKEEIKPDIEAILQGVKEYTDLQTELEILEKIKDKEIPDVSEIKAKRTALNAEINTLRQQLAIKEIIAQSNKRVDELSRQEKEFAQQLSLLEQKEFVIANFEKAYIDTVTEKINALFTLVRFKMFDTQINGSVVPCCETMVNGVPYSDLNNGSRINAGREIISVLNKYYDIMAPVFTDNAESITALYPLSCQTVNLVVSAADQSLRIE